MTATAYGRGDLGAPVSKGWRGRGKDESAFGAAALAAVAFYLGGLAVELRRLFEQRLADARMIILGDLTAPVGPFAKHCGIGHGEDPAKRFEREDRKAPAPSSRPFPPARSGTKGGAKLPAAWTRLPAGTTLGTHPDAIKGTVLFPDPTIDWQPYPSIIDGIERPPFVFVQGLWRGVLRLVVVAPKHHRRAYGVEIGCQIFAAYEEMIYSIADHGGRAGMYGGGVYIKEAARSALLLAYAATDPAGRKARHFSFVGGDYCYEVLGFGDPIVHAFDSDDEAFAWGRSETE